jgi:hypothetical protein
LINRLQAGCQRCIAVTLRGQVNAYSNAPGLVSAA